MSVLTTIFSAIALLVAGFVGIKTLDNPQPFGASVLSVYQGGTGRSSFPAHMVLTSASTTAGNLEASSTPQVGAIIATTTSASTALATSTFWGGISLRQGTQIDDLVSCDTIDTDSNGYLKCGSDGGGGGSSLANTALMSKWATSTADATAIYSANATSIGVGSSTPSTNLSIQGNALIAGTTTAKAFVATGTIHALGPTGTSTFAGAIGIGTTNPQNQLEIFAASTPGIRLIRSGTNFGSQFWYDCLLCGKNIGALAFGVGESADPRVNERMRITSDGLVGIGLFEPWDMLTVSGDVSVGGGDIRLKASAANATTTLQTLLTGFNIISSATTTVKNLDGAFSGFSAGVGVDATFIIESGSGRVGISSTSPSRLHVLSVQGNTLISGTTTINGLIATSTIYGGNVVTTASSTLVGLTVSSQGLKVSNLTSCTSELETDSAGNIICGTSSAGTPGGSDTQIQFNDAGSFAGAVGLVWDKTNLFLGVGSTTPRQVLSIQGNTLISGTTTFVGPLNIASSTGQIFVNGYNPISTIILTSAGGTPNAANNFIGAWGPELIATSTGPHYYVLDFFDSFDQCALWQITMPDSWNGGAMTAQVYWTATTTPTTGNVVWSINAVSYGDGTNINTAFNATTTITDAVQSAGVNHKSPVSASFTPSGLTGGGNMIVFEVCRTPADASDTYAGGARLLQTKIEYSKSQFSD